MSTSTTWKIGQKVQLNDGRSATVRYIGNLHFTAGDWVGVELEDASGKNDGSAKGERYFECATGYGIFLRPTMIARAGEQQPQPTPNFDGVTNAQPVRGRPSSGILGSTLSRVSKFRNLTVLHRAGIFGQYLTFLLRTQFSSLHLKLLLANA